MIYKSPVVRVVLLFILTIFSFVSNAQPQLPDIAGTADKGVVILTWNCQFDGIKSIEVQRSSDSAHNFATIGYVKNLKKGIQAFIDGHPAAGKNFYQLYIIFSSDLTWNSNHIKFHIDSNTLENERVVLPPNDSLQKFVISDNDRPTKSKSGIVVRIDTSAKKDRSDNERIMDAMRSNNMVTSNGMSPTDSTAEKKHSISISIGTDESDVNPYSYVKSHYVFTNPLTGHVNMEVPDVTSHHYSVKFFNEKGQQILEVPKITASPIIIDKRNFQHKGLYKFILRQDNSEMESGFITIY